MIRGYYTDITDAALQFISSLVYLQHLDFDVRNCAKITVAGIACIASSLVALTHLNIRGRMQITDDYFLAIGQQLIHLQHLNIAGCTNISDAGLRNIANLHQLTHLDLSGCFNVSDEGIKLISRLPLEVFYFRKLRQYHRCLITVVSMCCR